MRTVLLVDRDLDSHFMYATALKYFGFTVIPAWSAVEGISLAQRDRPDVIVLEFSMRDVPGAEAAMILRMDAWTASIPIVGLDAHSRGGDAPLTGGVNVYLLKPVTPREIVEHVARLVGPEREEP
ncbi:MAG: response regulator [Gemmatimonadota bacterium]|nr:response regulator [Gemmatimonadota bacterium]